MIISILCSLKGTISLFLVEGKLCVKCLLLVDSRAIPLRARGRKDFGRFNKIRWNILKWDKRSPLSFQLSC